jgi:transglutaminase-like putative cysteine protease
MRVAINHETVYRYSEPANYSIQYLRLTPLSNLEQRVVSWRLTAPGTLTPWTDAFGNSAHVLVVDKPHDEIRITATGEIEIADGGRPLLSDGEPHPPELYLRPTPLTAADEKVVEFATRFKPAIISNPRRGLDGLADGIRRTLGHRPGTSHGALSARDALKSRSGQSQDYAHLFISCCRTLGVPARFVSGYLCSDGPGAAKISGHAWAETWVEGAGWMFFDVASPVSNARAHVRVAVGLDQLDAAPVRAMRKGADDDLDVVVSVDDARRARERRLQDQQQQ